MPEIAELKKRQWSREEVAEKMEAYEEAYQRTPSQRQVAEELKIPRSTLQHWLERKDSLDAEPEVVAFFESCVGVAFLHRLVLAAHFVITLLGPSGIRRVCLFLELTGLDRFVAASYGTQQQVSVAMEESNCSLRQRGEDAPDNGHEAQADHGLRGRDVSSGSLSRRHRAGVEFHPAGAICRQPKGRDLDPSGGGGDGRSYPWRLSRRPVMKAQVSYVT